MHTVYTIGHSTRSMNEFTELLKLNAIELLVDVRRFPGSRRFPHFNKGKLESSLNNAQINYKHIEALGGRRGKPSPGSANSGWKDDGFRAYADYMNTDKGQTAIELLLNYFSKYTTALMCAEALPWKCHRQIIADILVAKSYTVYHIMDHSKLEEHTLNPMAKIMDNKTVIYPEKPEQSTLFGLTIF